METVTNLLATLVFFFSVFVLGPLFVGGWVPALIVGSVLLARRKKRVGLIVLLIGVAWGIGIGLAVWIGARSYPGVPSP